MVRLIHRSVLFEALPAATQRDVLAMGQEQRIPRRDTVFRQGDTADSIYLLIEGRVKLLLSGSSGRAVLLAFVRAGEAFGYLGPLAGTSRAYTAYAVEDSVVLGWRANVFEDLLRRHPVIARNALRLTARQLQLEWIRLHDLATEPVARRVARTLLRMVPAGTGAVPVVPMMQQDLAELVGTTPPTLSRILAKWKARGLVEVGRERIALLRPAGLSRLAERDEWARQRASTAERLRPCSRRRKRD